MIGCIIRACWWGGGRKWYSQVQHS